MSDKKEPHRRPTFVSMYTGAGGLDLGFMAAGLNPVFSNDIFPEATHTYTDMTCMLAKQGIATMVTAEPLMQFDLETMLEHIRRCQPKVVNIGRNTRRNIELPEPTKEEVQQLISGLQEFTKVHVKENGKFWLA